MSRGGEAEVHAPLPPQRAGDALPAADHVERVLLSDSTTPTPRLVVGRESPFSRADVPAQLSAVKTVSAVVGVDAQQFYQYMVDTLRK